MADSRTQLSSKGTKLSVAFNETPANVLKDKTYQQGIAQAPRMAMGDSETPDQTGGVSGVSDTDMIRVEEGVSDTDMIRVEEGLLQSMVVPDDVVQSLAAEFEEQSEQGGEREKDDDESSVASRPEDLKVALPSDEELIAMLERRSVSVRQKQSASSAPQSASRVSFAAGAMPKGGAGLLRPSVPPGSARKSIRNLVVAETNQRLQFRKFEGPNHVRPDEETRYFIDNPIHYPPGHVPLGVLFPFYNEEAEELQASLQSLAAEVEAMGDLEELDATFQVCLVMDGWKAASESMRTWLKEEVFPVSLQDDPSIPWWVQIEECSASKATFSVCRVLNQAEQNRRETVSAMGRMSVLGGGAGRKARYNHLGEGLSQGAVPTSVGNDRFLHLSLLVKKDNRRKHNSHEWFLSPFCQEYNVNFAVLCDTGVLFGRQSVLHLVRHLEKHENSVGVTGRQRIMTARQQFGRRDRGIGWLWRSVQLAEYEMTVSCFMGFYSLLGALPVIPGPCGIYRIKDLVKSGTLKLYFDTVNAHTMQSGLVLSNAKLAEDRILAIAAALTSANEKRTRLVPEACFYNDAEVDSQRYLLQRRRWINGDLMLLVWMLFINPAFVLQAQGGTFAWRWMVYLVFFMRFLQMLATIISPALFAFLLYVAALDVLELEVLGLGNDTALYGAAGIAGFYVALALSSLLTAMCVKWSPVLFFTFLGFGAVSMILFIGVAFGNGWDPIGGDAVDSVAWAAFLLPFLVLLTSSLESFCRTVVNLFPYILCLPLTINYFAVYAFARTSDLSWGNRPAAKSEEDENAREERKLKAQYNRIGIGIAVSVLVVNLGVVAGLYYNDVFRYVIFLFAGFTAVLPLVGTFLFNLWRLFVHMKRCCCGAQTLARKIMRNRHERLALAVQKNALEERKNHRELVEMIDRLNERLDELTVQPAAAVQQDYSSQQLMYAPWSPDGQRGSIASGGGEEEFKRSHTGGLRRQGTNSGLKRQATSTMKSPPGNRRMTAGPQGLPDNKAQTSGGCLMS